MLAQAAKAVQREACGDLERGKHMGSWPAVGKLEWDRANTSSWMLRRKTFFGSDSDAVSRDGPVSYG